MPSELRRKTKRRRCRRDTTSKRDELRVRLVEKLTVIARGETAHALADEDVEAIDKWIAEHVRCRVRSCRQILGDLELVALAQVADLAALLGACLSPLEPASARTLRRASSLFGAERVRGVHVGSVAREVVDVADAIRELRRPRGRP